MSEIRREVRLNYEFFFTCLDCKAQYKVLNPDASVETIPVEGSRPLRAVLLTIPNACPDCHNIRPVEQPHQNKKEIHD